MSKVVITGATGFIGTVLVRKLRAAGHEIVVLTRDAARAQTALPGVTAVAAELQTPGAWTESMKGAAAVIHLAGASVGGHRWDARVKQEIRDSRVESARVMVEAIAAMAPGERPAALLCASGSDYYPFASEQAGFDDDEVTETDPAGESFLARVCKEWEREANGATALGVRVATFRTGLVLGPSAALSKLSLPFKLFVGGKIGSGRQWTSWIHVDDVVAVYVAAITDARYTGAFNLVADSTRAGEFAKALGHALHRPSWIPVPAFAVKLVAGEFAEHVLKGRRVVPSRLRQLGYSFQFPTLPPALASAVA